MFLWSRQKICTGMAISGDRIRAAVVQKNGGGIFVKDLLSVTIMPDTVKPSFKNENILEPEAFHECLQQISPSVFGKNVYVALPDACIKLFVWHFTQVPEDRTDIHKMILWRAVRTYDIPGDTLRISWERMGKTAENQHVFLVAMGMEEVITGYESALKAAGFFPKLLGPASLHQFNFYCDSIPETGTVAYLALFDEYIVLFVFSGGIPIFYRMTHQGMLGSKEGSAINDLDLLIQYYRSEFADVGIEKYYIASPIKSETRVQHILQDIDPIDFTILDETEMIRVVQQEQIFSDMENPEGVAFTETGLAHRESPGEKPSADRRLPFYTAALGSVL